MEVIYKKGSCKRGELFDVLVSKFVEGGWKILEDESGHKIIELCYTQKEV